MKRLSMLTAVATIALGVMPAFADMTLTSKDMKHGDVLANAQVFNGFGCSGKNISPQLSWTGVPKAAKSLALTVYDPDAPTGSGWWHWVAFNMPVTTTSLPTNASVKGMPAGTIQSMTDFGSTGYGGACPPAGDKPHHYVFTLYALDVDSLPLDEKASGALVGYYINAHMIDDISLITTYSRK